MTDRIRADSLQPGSTYALGYTLVNKGYDLFQFGGLTDPDNKYGDKDIKAGWGKYENIKDLKKKEKVTSTKQIEEIEDRYKEYGHGVYMVIRSYGGYNWGAYPFEGRWCAGSGAMPITFFSVREET